MRTRTIIFIVLALLLLARAPLPAEAQTPDRIAILNISVWPEYDDPSVLVIFDGEFAAKEGFPREVAFLVPTGARINATAYGDGKGEYFNTEPAKTEDAGNGWTRARFTLPQRYFHLEYYYNPLQGAPDKKMEFIYQSAHPADKAQVEIQVPLKATNFKTEPVAALQTSRGHDFKYHVFNFANIAVGQSLRVQVSYTKSDPNPSVANISIPSNALASDPSSAAASSNLILPIGIAAGGVALGVLGFIAWRMQRDPRREAPRRRTRNPRTALPAAYCHECGNGLRAEDLFCSKCGTRRKS